MNAEEYISSRLDDQIRWYDEKSQSNQRWYKRLRVGEVVCAAFIPFLSGHIQLCQDLVSLAIGVLGVIVASIAGLLGLYQFQENWIEYRTTCESLKKEKYLFLTDSESYKCDDKEKLQILVQRVESLISRENTNWSLYLSRPSEKKAGA